MTNDLWVHIFHLKHGGVCSNLGCIRRLLRLKVGSGSELPSRRCCRRRLHLHVTSSALFRLRRNRHILLHLCVVCDHNCEILQFATIYLDPRKPCSRLLNDICLFLGIFSLMRKAEGAVVPPMLGRILAVPATSPVVLASILTPSSTSTEGLVAATSPAYTLRTPALLPPCEFPFELMPPLLLLLFDEMLFPFEVLPPFPRRQRPYTRLSCLRNSCAPPCTTVLSARP